MPLARVNISVQVLEAALWPRAWTRGPALTFPPPPSLLFAPQPPPSLESHGPWIEPVPPPCLAHMRRMSRLRSCAKIRNSDIKLDFLLMPSA